MLYIVTYTFNGLLMEIAPMDGNTLARASKEASDYGGFFVVADLNGDQAGSIYKIFKEELHEDVALRILKSLPNLKLLIPAQFRKKWQRMKS